MDGQGEERVVATFGDDTVPIERKYLFALLQLVPFLVDVLAKVDADDLSLQVRIEKKSPDTSEPVTTVEVTLAEALTAIGSAIGFPYRGGDGTASRSPASGELPIMIFKLGRGYFAANACGYVKTLDDPRLGFFDPVTALGYAMRSVLPRLELCVRDGRGLIHVFKSVYPRNPDHDAEPEESRHG